MGDVPKFSVIICTRNRADLIGSAVESVLANDHPSFELLILDQGDDASAEKALKRFRRDKRFRYRHLDRVGKSVALNVGIEMTQAPLLAFTDDDCVVPPRWLSTIEAAFGRHPDVEFLYGQTLAGLGLETARGIVPSMSIGREEKIGARHKFWIGGMGADFSMRRTLSRRVGGFDEVLGPGGPLRCSEDFDFLFRSYRQGGSGLLCPDVWVHHYGLRTPEEWRVTLAAYGVGDGAFYLKHVRCGDVRAVWLIVTHMAKMILRELRNLLRRRPAHWTYVRSYLTGMRLSLRYPIDSEKRLYRSGEGVME